MLQHREPFDAFGGNDLALMWREARAVVITINTGVVDTLFYNPYHRQQVGGVPSLATSCNALYVAHTECWQRPLHSNPKLMPHRSLITVVRNS